MSEQRALETVLADWRERASGCRHVRDERVAEIIEEICREVSDATEDYRTWLSEGDAMLRSSKGRYWLRARFGDWARQGLARWSPRNARAREYRALVVPQRSDLAALRADARNAARGEGAA
jgi:hypothetical protein